MSLTAVSYHNNSENWKDYGKRNASTPIAPQSSSKIAMIFTQLQYLYFSYSYYQ